MSIYCVHISNIERGRGGNFQDKTSKVVHVSVASPKVYITLVFTVQPSTKREVRNLTCLSFNFLLKTVFSSKLLRILNLKSFLGMKDICLFLMMKE